MASSTNNNPASTMDDRAWIQLHYWAEKTTKEWTTKASLDWKRSKRRNEMASLRLQKKNRLHSMQDELETLEKQFKGQLAHLNSTVSVSEEAKLSQAVLRLALESDTLRTENTELHCKLQQHIRLASLAQEGLVDSNTIQGQHVRIGNVYDACEKSPWTSRPDSTDSGWRVQFPNGEPSFHFHPFTHDHFDDVIQTCHSVLGEDPPYIKLVGSLFGWKMHSAPLTRRREDELPVTHARFTTRFQCSLDDMNDILPKLGLSAWPLISTPPNW
ncbi:hypothetical protein PC128_g23769, partial [Phytophthora cactorum]